MILNILTPRQNGLHFADDSLKRIFINENVRISIKISLKFVPKCPINNIQALVRIMAWRRPGDKPLSESMLVSLLTHICVTQPQWVNTINASILPIHSKTYWVYSIGGDTSFTIYGMLCTAQLPGPVLKAFGRAQISPFQMAVKWPMITDRLTAGGSVSQLSQLAKLSPWLTLSTKDITTSFWHYKKLFCFFI